MLLVAIAEDDTDKFKKAVNTIGKDHLLQMTFEHDMNALNLACDQEAASVVKEI